MCKFIATNATTRAGRGTPVLAGPPEVTGADMIKAMDSVGVDGALLISVYTMYRWDASYAVGVRKAHPGRFALIKPVNPNDPRSPTRSPNGGDGRHRGDRS